MHPFEQMAIYSQVEDCKLCREICNNGRKVFGYGAFGQGKIMIVGEAPGREEAETAVPFIGPSGQTLRKLINEAGMDWDHIYITNTIKCRPTGNRDPLPNEMENCSGYLAAQIYALRPSMIMAVGRIAMGALIDTSLTITKAAGTFHKFYDNSPPMRMNSFKNFVKFQYGINVDGVFSIIMPILHPSYINRCGGENSEQYQATLKQLNMIWKDYVDKKGWYTLLNSIPF